MISFPRLFKQRIKHIEKASKEHSINWAFWNSESVKPLSRKMIHCFEALQSYRESFDSERDFKAHITNHLIQNGTSKRVSQIIWFRMGLQSTRVYVYIYIYIYIYIYTHTHTYTATSVILHLYKSSVTVHHARSEETPRSTEIKSSLMTQKARINSGTQVHTWDWHSTPNTGQWKHWANKRRITRD